MTQFQSCQSTLATDWVAFYFPHRERKKVRLKPVLLHITVVTLSQHNCNTALCVTQTYNVKRYKHSGDVKQ